MLCLLFGWDASNPGIANSKMILFVPGGFIFGGYGVPLTMMPEWMHWFNQIFPLTWNKMCWKVNNITSSIRISHKGKTCKSNKYTVHKWR